MRSLHQLETVVFLFVAVLALTTVAQRILIPYPILLVIGGLILGVIPGLPSVSLSPDLVFLVFLPPILSAAGYFTSLRDFRANLRPITLLAVGLVLATTAAVALAAHAMLPGLSWAAAIALGAIVSPTDAVAATALDRRLHIPHRMVTILEGESLVNDATALMLYRTAVAAVESGTFVLSETLLQFVLTAVIGVVVGLATGALTRWALTITHDSFTAIAITLLAPYVAWVFAGQLHGSAVLACVAAGFYLRQHFSAVVAPTTRLQGRAVWDLLVFLLNGFIFILIGLELGTLRESVPPDQLGSLIWKGTLLSVVAIVVRLIWVPIAAYLPRRLSASLRTRDPLPPWRHLFILAWTGMRGVVSLAAALALPLTTTAGTPFPFRTEIIMITFMVIFCTLVLQGLSLKPLIRALKPERDSTLEREEILARDHAATAALARLDDLAKESWLSSDEVDRIRQHYARQVHQFADKKGGGRDEAGASEASDTLGRLQREMLMAERLAVIRLRDKDAISDEVLIRIEHELDIEALRLGLGEQRVTTPQTGTQ